MSPPRRMLPPAKPDAEQEQRRVETLAHFLEHHDKLHNEPARRTDITEIASTLAAVAFVAIVGLTCCNAIL